MNRLLRAPVLTIPILVIGAGATPCFPQNLERLYENAEVLWQTEEPSCFDPKIPFPEQMEEVNRFEVSGQASEPRKISSGELPEDLLAGSDVPRGVPIHELVVNASGSVESVVALKPISPELDAALAEYYRSFQFEPARVDEDALCVRYIVTTHINWR
jgi:hypothetical protein